MGMTLLPNRTCPDLEFPVLGPAEDRWNIDQATPETFSLLIFYRGLHCPICRSYLREFERRYEEFVELGVELVALSMDDKDRAMQARKQWELCKLPLGYGLKERVARMWGLYISESIKDDEPLRFSEPGLFLVRPNRRLFYVGINSMPFGRPHPDDMLDAVEFSLQNDYPARGRIAA